MPESDPAQLPAEVPEEGVDSLYGLPLDEFTASRDRLAKELRSDGQKPAADWVKGLRRPTAAAWIVNQLARTQRKDAKRLLDSADALRAAQDRVFAGEATPHELAQATEEAAAASRELLAKAPGLLDRQGRSPRDPTLDKVAETLRAIALDDEARAGFAAGRLTREHQASGFGLVASEREETGARTRKAPAKSKPKAKPAPKAKSAPSAKQVERARAALEKARSRHEAQAQRMAEAARALRMAERDAQTAQRRAERAATELEQARAKHDETQARLDEAQRAWQDLR
ncbi:MAG TPA: hypothetical protein VFL87_06835 [Thermoleophilaceae bacterium]|nr:hypothetical protein [Thermoleophilaceae bacterium]